MADGKQWTTRNLDLEVAASYCYDDKADNCRRYGRLYTWEAAQRACRMLGSQWRLPTDAEFRRLAKEYGGVREDSNDLGAAAYAALLSGGRAGFGAVLGGNREAGGAYARGEAHGFYWTSTISSGGAWFYNFGRGAGSLNRHADGDPQMAISVRCIQG